MRLPVAAKIALVTAPGSQVLPPPSAIRIIRRRGFGEAERDISFLLITPLSLGIDLRSCDHAHGDVVDFVVCPTPRLYLRCSSCCFLAEYRRRTRVMCESSRPNVGGLCASSIARSPVAARLGSNRTSADFTASHTRRNTCSPPAHPG
jgi:hypothetical protein